MKKRISVLLILLVLVLGVPFSVHAKDGNTVSTTLAEAAKEEGIEFNHSNYKEDSSKAKIYMFRGHNCKYCYNLLKFLESIVDEYGKYFDLVSYEVWNDSDNSKLMNTVASVFGESADGVPYLVIGDKTYIGYTSSYDDNIKKDIKALYNSTDRYDVMQHLDEAKNNEKEEKNEEKESNKYNLSSSTDTATLIYVVTIATFVLGALYIVKSNIDNAKLRNEISGLKLEIASIKENMASKEKTTPVQNKEEKIVKKDTKKTKKKKETKE